MCSVQSQCGSSSFGIIPNVNEIGKLFFFLFVCSPFPIFSFSFILLLRLLHISIRISKWQKKNSFEAFLCHFHRLLSCCMTLHLNGYSREYPIQDHRIVIIIHHHECYYQPLTGRANSAVFVGDEKIVKNWTERANKQTSFDRKSCQRIACDRIKWKLWERIFHSLNLWCAVDDVIVE